MRKIIYVEYQEQKEDDEWENRDAKGPQIAKPFLKLGRRIQARFCLLTKIRNTIEKEHEQQ